MFLGGIVFVESVEGIFGDINNFVNIDLIIVVDFLVFCLWGFVVKIVVWVEIMVWFLIYFSSFCGDIN